MPGALLNGHLDPDQDHSALANMEPASKRRKHGTVVHQHRIRYKQPIGSTESLPEQDARDLLMRSIKMALTAAGFEKAEPLALESFRSDVERYLLHLLFVVSDSMLKGRRVRAIPQDFADALAVEQISLDDLLPHLQTSPLSPSDCQPALRPATPTESQGPSLSAVLGPELSGSSDRSQHPFIPANFPSFPSKHSYRFTPDVRHTESDPRRVRERATEEARLGEEALRRLMSAARGDGKERDSAMGSGRSSTKRKMLDDLWLETMQEIAKEEGKEGHSASPATECGVVNYETRYWRKIVPRAQNPSQQINGTGKPAEGDPTKASNSQAADGENDTTGNSKGTDTTNSQTQGSCQKEHETGGIGEGITVKYPRTSSGAEGKSVTTDTGDEGNQAVDAAILST